jgi:hypothetical protein
MSSDCRRAADTCHHGVAEIAPISIFKLDAKKLRINRGRVMLKRLVAVVTIVAAAIVAVPAAARASFAARSLAALEGMRGHLCTR